MAQKWILLFCCLMLVGITGCDTTETAGLKIDLSQLNWQTGALIALAYFANSKGHLATVALLLADLFTQLQGQPDLQAKVLDLMQASSTKAVANASKQ
jgi:hypothetical protein